MILHKSMSAAECMVVISCSAADLMTSMHEMIYVICNLAYVRRRLVLWTWIILKENLRGLYH